MKEVCSLHLDKKKVHGVWQIGTVLVYWIFIAPLIDTDFRAVHELIYQ